MDGHRKGVDNQHLMKSNGLVSSYYRVSYLPASKFLSPAKCSFDERESSRYLDSTRCLFQAAWLLLKNFFMGNARARRTTTQSPAGDDKQVGGCDTTTTTEKMSNFCCCHFKFAFHFLPWKLRALPADQVNDCIRYFQLDVSNTIGFPNFFSSRKSVPCRLRLVKEKKTISLES